MASDLQFGLDFTAKLPSAVQEEIADGMRRADEHADPFWKTVIDACIFAAARKHRELTVDDVLDEIDLANQARQEQSLPPVETHNLAAIRAGHEAGLYERDPRTHGSGEAQRARRQSIWQPAQHLDQQVLWSAVMADVLVQISNLKGSDPQDWPEALRVREYPAVRA